MPLTLSKWWLDRGLAAYGPARLPIVIARNGASVAFSRLGLRHPWLRVKANSRPASPLRSFRLFAILGTWMEEDVIGATVRNVFSQGCDRVFLVDAGSPDLTVAAARAAGAEVVDSLSTDTYGESARVRLMNDTVARVSADEGAEHIWWLWLDADEFPHGPRGLTVRDFLSTVDESFRVVGARYVNHYPSAEPQYVTGFHPLDFQPLCEEIAEPMCVLFHRKHPLQRFDRGRPSIEAGVGFHRAYSAERPLFEPTESVFVHHFPFREQRVTRQRLRRLFGDGGAHARANVEDEVDMAARDMAARLRLLDAVYEQRWSEIGTDLGRRFRQPRRGLVPWTSLVSPEDAAVKRWY